MEEFGKCFYPSQETLKKKYEIIEDCEKKFLDLGRADPNFFCDSFTAASQFSLCDTEMPSPMYQESKPNTF